MFPLTEEDYQALFNSKKTVVYAETIDENTSPDNTQSWSFWAIRTNEDASSMATWRKIVTLEEASLFD